VRSPHFDIWWLQCYNSVQSCSLFSAPVGESDVVNNGG
jgi:hypothetical protein